VTDEGVNEVFRSIEQNGRIKGRRKNKNVNKTATVKVVVFVLNNGGRTTFKKKMQAGRTAFKRKKFLPSALLSL
jgi:hypothetical protein